MPRKPLAVVPPPTEETPGDREIERVWRQGKQALDAAIEHLLALPVPGTIVSELLEILDYGDLCEAGRCVRCVEGGDVIADLLESAIASRNHVLGLIEREHNPRFEAIASDFRRSLDREDDLARARERILLKLYTWEGVRPFKAWLITVVYNTLREGTRRTRRRDDKHARYAATIGESVAPAVELDCKGTTTVGAALSLRSYAHSLDGYKRALWECAARLAADGFRPEESYEILAREHGKTAGAVKAAVLRMHAEYRDMTGVTASGVEVSRSVALWIGCETHGAETAIMVFGIDPDAQIRLLVVRQVRRASTRVFMRMFQTLRRWGLPDLRRFLAIIDESDGLRSAVADAFGDQAVVQLCTDRVREGVLARLPAHARPGVSRRLERAYAAPTAEAARVLLAKTLTELAGVHEEANEYLARRIDASLTVKRLGIPSTLQPRFSRFPYVAADLATPWAPFAWLANFFTAMRGRRRSETQQEALQHLKDALGSSADRSS